jgi:hypothetical protein
MTRLLGLAGSNLEGSSIYNSVEGRKGLLRCFAVVEVNETISWVSSADGIDGDMYFIQAAESFFGENFFDLKRLGLVGEITCQENQRVSFRPKSSPSLVQVTG